ncbi:MAG TPA: hypothetical protein VMW93_07605, partial [bacterium]|nr:hypothetical protein [bacterium]
FDYPRGVGVAPNNNVYVGDTSNYRVQYFTSAGSYLGKWGIQGSEIGRFRGLSGLTVAADGTVYVVDMANHRVQYFSPNGSFLGTWGTQGSGDGEFNFPVDVALAPNGDVYVLEFGMCRVQYFRWSDPAVVPTSLGPVKALFR